MSTLKKTLVVGASPNPARTSYEAVKRLVRHQHPVVAFGIRAGNIEMTPIVNEKPHDTNFHTITLYVNPEIQKEYMEWIISLRPQRLIFNPGAENDSFADRARAAGIEVLEACTLVMLSVGNY